MLRRLGWLAYTGWQTLGQARYGLRSPKRIKRDQDRRVRRMVEHAWRYVPYYRETMERLGLRPSAFREACDLAKLPVLERDVVQDNPEQFVSRAQRKERCLTLESGGSTGVRLSVLHTPEAAFQSVGHGERHRAVVANLLGRRFGYRETLVLSAKNQNLKMRRFWWHRSALLDGIPVHRQRLSMADSPEKNLPKLNEFRPDVLYSYGSYLELLFTHVWYTGKMFHVPKVVGFGADGLSESARRLIQEQFGVQVLSSYHAIEASRVAFECEQHTGVHINADIYPVRIVNAQGDDVPLGESGDVVVSNLVNRGMVLLNYRLGDIAALLSDRCPCGRNLPLMSFPKGRSDDWIVLPSGRLLHAQVAIGAGAQTGVRQVQVEQQAPDRITIRVIPDPRANTDLLQRLIVREALQGIGESVQVAVEFVQSIERTAVGKHRTLISHVYQGRRGVSPSGAVFPGNEA